MHYYVNYSLQYVNTIQTNGNYSGSFSFDTSPSDYRAVAVFAYIINNSIVASTLNVWVTKDIASANTPCCVPTSYLSVSGVMTIDYALVNLSWSSVTDASQYDVRLNDSTSERYDDLRFATCIQSLHYYCENSIKQTFIDNIPVKENRSYAFWIDTIYIPTRNYCNGRMRFKACSIPYYILANFDKCLNTTIFENIGIIITKPVIEESI